MGTIHKHSRQQQSGENCHEEQCLLVPNVIDHNLHGVHMEPCYKKFTLILSKRKVEQVALLRTSRCSSSGEAEINNGEECYF